MRVGACGFLYIFYDFTKIYYHGKLCRNYTITIISYNCCKSNHYMKWQLMMWRVHGPLLTVKFRQPSHEFTFGVGISFIPYPLVLTPLV
jgi:hypothetical protein